MASHMEVVSLCDPPAQLDDLVRAEFNDPTAPATDHVVMGCLAERMFIMGELGIKAHLLENAAVHQEGERTVDGGLAHSMAPLPQEIQDLFRFEMIPHVQNDVQDLPPCGGVANPVILQVFAEGLPQLVRSVKVIERSHQ